MSTNVFDTLQERGFLYQTTDEENLRKLLGGGPVTFYVGFDPTATSMHVGNLVPIMAMVHLQRAGHRPIAIVGGATGMVGDPSGKTEARTLLDKDALHKNCEYLKTQLGRYLDFGEEGAKLLNNLDWIGDLNYIDFLREIGRHFSVNRMLTAESVKLRLETGLSFLEFNYMLLQAYDFAVLAKDHGCILQMGGQDQWGNIVMGIDLARRVSKKSTYGMTFPLVTNSAGEKFGKSVAGAIWIEAEQTSPYHYYQFWRNLDDRDVAKMAKLYTFLPASECDAICEANINRAKEILAFEATKITHGAPEAEKSYAASVAEFGSADPDGRIETTSDLPSVDLRLKASGKLQKSEEGIPTSSLTTSDLEQTPRLIELLTRADLATSASEARRLIKQGGAYLNEERMSDPERVITGEDVQEGKIALRAGKKRHHRFTVTND